MAQLISAKGNDILAWRATGEFAVTYRQALIDSMEFCRAGEAADMLNGAIRHLEELAAANDAFCSRAEQLLAEVRSCDDPAGLRVITENYYGELYAHHAIHRSAPAFYQLSTQFLHALAEAVCGYGFRRLDSSARDLPSLALVALGPAGRQEFSPFCPLQFLLVHEHAGETDRLLVTKFASFVHEGFAACGLRPDDVVSPQTPLWRGSQEEWERQIEMALDSGTSAELVEMLRLTDQTVLYGVTEIFERFRRVTMNMLAGSHAASANLVSRVGALTNGIGIIGGLRFERSGRFRGQFALLEHGLQPLSASLATLALPKRLETVSTPRRIRELLWRRDLNVDMAERLIRAWHFLHDMRLDREMAVQPAWSELSPRYVDVDTMSVEEQEAFRESLEAVGTVQRHISLNFSGMGE